MKICFCESSAQTIWRHFDNRIAGKPLFGHTPNAGPLLAEALPTHKLPYVNDPSIFGTNLELLGPDETRIWGIPEHAPLHLLVSREKRSRSNARVVAHSAVSDLPAKAFLELRPGIHVLSPEHLFVRHARNSDLISQIMLGYELAGCYSIRSDLDQGFFQRPPLCSTKTLSSFLSEADGMPGIKQARTALPLIIEGSASPRETGLVMMLCLPARLGGYGLPAPKMNVRLDLGKDAKPFWGERNAFDLVWQREKLIVEYDGMCHGEEAARIRDTLRRDASLLAGYSVFTIMRDRMETPEDMLVIARAVAKKLGVQLRPRSKDFERKNRELWRRVIRSPHP